MKRVILIFIVLAVSACMPDFNPEESEVAGTTLYVDLMPVIRDVMMIDEVFFEGGRIPDEYAGMARLRVRTYCYDNEGRLVEKQSSSHTDFNKPATFKFANLKKSTEYRFVAVADFYIMRSYNEENDIWFHILTGSPETMYFKRVEGSYGNFDIIGYASGRSHPSNSEVTLSLVHLGTSCQIEFLNAGEVTRIYNEYTGLSAFSPIGDRTKDTESYFYWTNVLEEPYDSLYNGIYIIPPASGTSKLTFRITRSDLEEPLNTSAIIDLIPGNHLKIQINCQDGQILCTEN